MRLINKILFFLGLALPVLFVFRALFLSGPLVFGDAPHFWPEGLKELVAEPYAWVGREIKFGGINSVLWLSPLMFIYGALHKLFGIGNDLIIRILFYFPSVILAILSPILLTRYLKYSKTVQFFSALIFSLNTYFLLLIDGGQVGMALAYGLFPLALLQLKKLIDDPGHKTFFTSLFFLFLLTVADPRLSAIAFLTIVIWGFLEKNSNLKYLVLTAGALIGLSAYWLVPLLKLGGQSLSMDVSDLQFLSLLNPLLLFSPHWPANIFGKISPPPFYFIGMPFLIFGRLLLKPRRKHFLFAFLFLIFAFLTKGSTPPLGGWYDWMIKNIPLGTAFRDSSKFFVPLILLAGILIGNTVEKLKHKWISAGSYLFLLFLIFPAFLGNLNFILSDRSHSADFKIIYGELRNENGFFRTAWFPEKHPLAFHTEEKPALDAKNLVNSYPLASMNVGTDRFNFMHNENFIDWFKIFGIKYLVFSGDHRAVQVNEDEQKNWNDLLKQTATISGLTKVDWGTDIPIYEIAETRPQMFAVDRLVAVVGPPITSYQLPVTSIYFEDGKLDPENLEGIASESAVLVFNNKDETDLAMSFLQEYFVGINDVAKSDWAYYGTEKYLDWKYQLLIRGIDTREFDYGKGIAFSSQPNEKLALELKTEEDGEYIFAVRSMVSAESNSLGFELNRDRGEIEHGKSNQFEWFTKPVSLKRGKQQLILGNLGGLQVVNTVALVPKEEWDKAQNLTTTYIEHFGTADLSENLEQEWQEIDFEKTSPARYKVSLPAGPHWIVLTDSFHPLWILKRDQLVYPSLPAYSTSNVFYRRPEWNDAEIVFEGQKEVRWGLYFSVLSILTLAIIFLWFYPDKQSLFSRKLENKK